MYPFIINRGCIFVGHGLSQDFRVINICIPPNQIIDTAEIYHQLNQRFEHRNDFEYCLGEAIRSGRRDFCGTRIGTVGRDGKERSDRGVVESVRRCRPARHAHVAIRNLGRIDGRSRSTGQES